MAEVVVLFPLVPVTPITWPGATSKKRLTSDVTCCPLCARCFEGGRVGWQARRPHDHLGVPRASR